MNLVHGITKIEQAELKQAKSGLSIADLKLTTDNGMNFATAFGDTAEALAGGQGLQLVWHGRLTSRNYTKQDGEQVWAMGITIGSAKVVEHKPDTPLFVEARVSGDASPITYEGLDGRATRTQLKFAFDKRNGQREEFLVLTDDASGPTVAVGTPQYRSFDLAGVTVRTYYIPNALQSADVDDPLATGPQAVTQLTDSPF